MRRLGQILVVLFFTALSAAGAVLANEPVTGLVVGITDGDTLTLLTAGHDRIKLRLAEIDAPESGQPFGTKAKQALSDLVFDKIVRAVLVDTDRYGRMVARVYANDLDVNAEMVRNGFAWAYREYLSDTTLLTLEEEARRGKRGLWGLQKDQRVEPWVWRRPKAELPRVRKPAATGLAETSCGNKRYCKQMASCAEARRYLRDCGLARLDGDGDGVPCEALCR
ncbi:MAG: hypothetical protein ABS36_08655 [Acidobacteria bacterium SCN 69-37]|nr:MAG: hypothetical protein ABS36_08655 [Acidobacteria bacterium SCN 69-37]